MIEYWTTVGRLKEDLAQLADDLRLECNAVGNLLISNADGDYLGYISIRPYVGLELFEQDADDAKLPA